MKNKDRKPNILKPGMLKPRPFWDIHPDASQLTTQLECPETGLRARIAHLTPEQLKCALYYIVREHNDLHKGMMEIFNIADKHSGMTVSPLIEVKTK